MAFFIFKIPFRSSILKSTKKFFKYKCLNLLLKALSAVTLTMIIVNFMKIFTKLFIISNLKIVLFLKNWSLFSTYSLSKNLCTEEKYVKCDLHSRFQTIKSLHVFLHTFYNCTCLRP